MPDSVATPKIVIIGAAGQMTSVTARALIERLTDHAFLLIDIHTAALERIFGVLKSPSVALHQGDLNDLPGLRAAIEGARLVIHGAGPFHITAAKVRGLCVELGVDYLDIDDDVESTEAAIALDEAARDRGMALYVGHGASPGVTNVVAADLIRRLDEPKTVEVAWTVGDEGKQNLGRAVAEHAIHIGAGPCRSWSGGGPVMHESFGQSTVFPMGGPLGHYRLYECAHPEPITLPWSFPQLREVTCWGGLHPQSVNGLLRGVSLAVVKGELSMDQGCAFMQAVMADRFGSLAGWRYALAGMSAQVRAGEATGKELRGFLWDALRSVHRPTRAGIAARVTGRRGGQTVTLLRQSEPLQSGTFLETMASMTGLAAAAFALMALSGPKRTGFQPPERWADGETFFALAGGLGPIPLPSILGPVIETVHP